MKVLVVVASKHGSTREIGEAIADELRSALFTVDVREVLEVGRVAGYDAVVLGSGVYAGSWLPEMKSFVHAYYNSLLAVPIWAFSSGPLGEHAESHDDPERLLAPLGKIAVRDHRIFVGKLDSQHLGLGERLIVKVVRAPEGDFRDWAAIRAWAHEIANSLRPAVAFATP
jgi:menaquinone-dependent protoporphyrinogen oxidase